MLDIIRKDTKNALVIGPGGLGDHIWMSGGVRYIAKKYKETHLFVSKTCLNTVQVLYKDVPSIKLVLVIRVDDELRSFIKRNYNKSNIYTCVHTKDLLRGFITDINDIPGAFYDQMEIPRNTRHTHFVCPRLPESIALFETVKNQPYIFVQTKSSTTKTNIVSWDISQTLTIDPNVNLYSLDNPWYELSQTFVNQPFFHYVDLIKHASELHLVNSSFYTLASQIPPLDAKVKVCYERYDGGIMPNYNFS
jgi:hypothetical protein